MWSESAETQANKNLVLSAESKFPTGGTEIISKNKESLIFSNKPELIFETTSGRGWNRTIGLHFIRMAFYH